VTSQKPIICIVDDERGIGSALLRLFRRVDARVEAFVEPREALSWLQANPVDVLITDQRMPGMTGIELIESLQGYQDHATKFVLSGYSDFDDITAAFNTGLIHKYISKPWDDDELVFSVSKVLEHSRELVEPSRDCHGVSKARATIIGDDPVMRRLNEEIVRFSTANVPVFIHGETGTGKELVARSLHAESFRAKAPFVPINCASFSPTLMEAQLFGYKKGAFTGAEKDNKGLLAAADGGTLFLDEITSMPLGLQARLLRVLQERAYTPLGTAESVSFDALILSASSVRLSQAVSDGQFREDLRYRLEVLPLDIPPLRERGSDPLLLFNFFIKDVRQDTVFEHTPEFAKFLQNYQWPGNIRQLANIASYVATMAQSESLTLDCLPKDVLDSYLGQEASMSGSRNCSEITPAAETGESDEKVIPLKDMERNAIQKALDIADGNTQQAAVMLGVSASTIYRKIQAWQMTEQGN